MQVVCFDLVLKETESFVINLDQFEVLIMRSMALFVAVFFSSLISVMADLNIDREPSDDLFSSDVPASETDNPSLAFGTTDHVSYDGIVGDPNGEQTLPPGASDEQSLEASTSVVQNCPPNSAQHSRQRKTRRDNGFCVPSTREREPPENSGGTQHGGQEPHDGSNSEPDVPDYFPPAPKQPLLIKKNLKICPRGIFFDSNIAVCYNGGRTKTSRDAVNLYGGYLCMLRTWESCGKL